MRRGGRDEEPPVREWLQGPPRGWGDDEDGPDEGARRYIAQDYTEDYGAWDLGARDAGPPGPGAGAAGRRRARGSDAEDRYRGSRSRRDSAYGGLDDDATGYGIIERYVPGRDGDGGGSGYGRGSPGYGASGHGTSGYGAADSGPTGYGAAGAGSTGYGAAGAGTDTFGGGDYRRRRRPGEEYVPRRAANEPPLRAADEQSRRRAGRSDRDWDDESPRGRAEGGRAEGGRAEGEGGGRDQDGTGKKARRKRKQMPLWQEMPLLLIVAFCLAVLIRTFLVQAFYIPSGSMTDTLLVGDRVLVNKVVYDMRDPRRGEIVVFSGTDSWVPEVPPDPDQSFMAKLGRTVGDLVGVTRPGDKDFIKRVIGLPGDRVSCCDTQGRVQVNGKPLDEPYVIENSPLDAPPNPRECRSRRFEEVVVQPGQMWVMGDHRLVSQDARCQGPVPIKNIIGKAFVVVWPKKSWATLPTPSTFDDVPTPGVVAAPAGDLVRPISEPPTGIFGIVLPIMVALGFPARTRRNFPGDRRRLAE